MSHLENKSDVERLTLAFGTLATFFGVVTIIAIVSRNVGQLVGSVPCRRIALWSRNQHLKVRRKFDRVTGLTSVRLRMTAPGVEGTRSLVYTPDEALMLADFLEEAARKASPG